MRRRVRNAPLVIAVLAVVALGLAGCQTPSVTLRNATARSPGFDGVHFDATLAVHNPNGFDVQVRAVRANVRIENIPTALPVIYSPNVWIPADQTVYVSVPVSVPWTMVPSVLAQTVTKSKVNFRVMGNADVTATQLFKIEQDGYRFNEQGELPRGMFLLIGGQSRPPVTFGMGQY